MLRVILAFLLTPFAALSAEFETHVITDDSSVPVFVQLTGIIEPGDAETFEALIEGRPKVTVLLDSPGGVVQDALRIGAAIRLNDYATMVADGGACYSACGLIWLSSQRRYMSATSQIGFHAAYRQVGDYMEESGVANAEIGSFLTHLGLRVEAIRFFTQRGPLELELLTPRMARALGIDIYLQEGTHVIPPWENLTVDRMAREKVALMVAGSVCEDVFDLPERRFVDQLEAYDTEGTTLVGDFWHELWLREIDQFKPSGPGYTMAHACLQAEGLARQAGYRVFEGPSFACDRASTDAELAICGDEELHTKDRALSGLYFFILEAGNPEVQLDRFREFHAAWLDRRNGCGANGYCLHAAYDEIIAIYGQIHWDTQITQQP